MILFGILIACTEAPAPQKTEAPPVDKTAQPVDKTDQTQIDVQALYQKRQSNKETIIIDVRTEAEFREGHIPGAQLYPLSTLERDWNKLGGFKDKEIFLVCASGGRSQTATNLLRSKGFSKAINVQGGTRGWRAKGYPVE